MPNIIRALMGSAGAKEPDELQGELWCWGENTNGQLGLNSTVNYSSPVQVGSLTDWATPGAGDQISFTVKTDGTLWSWGSDSSGVLGHETNYVAKSSPTQVGSLTDWFRVSAGFGWSCAIKTDGTLWSWGSGLMGRSGQDDLIARSSPVQVGSLTNWKGESSADLTAGWPLKMSAASYGGLIIKDDGTLWSWGSNAGGHYAGGRGGLLGQGDRVDRSSPVQVGSLTDWEAMPGGEIAFHIWVVKDDGTLWAWGNDNYGGLGLNTVNVHVSSPTQVGSLTTWKQSACGFYNSYATKTDGTLWACGRNQTQGALGDGTTINRSSPVQVGSDTDWEVVQNTWEGGRAIKTNGTMHLWGSGYYGQLGQNTNELNSSSPVQLGTYTAWSKIFAGTQRDTIIVK